MQLGQGCRSEGNYVRLYRYNADAKAIRSTVVEESKVGWRFTIFIIYTNLLEDT